MNIIVKIKSYFSEGHERSIIAKKNIAFSFLLKGIGIIIGLVLIPMTIKYVNESQYGIWLTLSSLVNWMNFFDVGLGNGLKNKISQTNALGQYKASRIYISSTYALLAIISILIFLMFLFINQFINWNLILNVSINSVKNLNQIIVFIVGFFCIQFILQIVNVVLTAVHATSKVSLITLISQIVSLIIIFLLTKYTQGSLLYLIIALSGVPLLVQIIASIWYYNHKYKYIAPSIKLINISLAKDILTIGGYFFLIQIGALILFETDNIVITQLFGPKEVTTFNIAYKLFAILVNVFTIVITPFWSSFTDAYTINDFVWIKGIFRKMYIYWGITVVIAIVLWIVSPFLYKLWLGSTLVNIPFILSASMVLYVAGFCWLMIHCYLLNGIGKIKLQLYLYIISTIVNIPLAIFLGKTIGIAGVTLSNVFVFFYMDIILYVQCKKILNNSASGIWAK
ncbi:lipopolysaccharide biosynthesis protein [Mucilaginibacter polytrichastri]|uniref:Polysaccharide biosynthesis protein C-terminal domain-containing protein n=1 Tax=Mucilaginibacter polytrichastri TaxID=1302689 RepID=A0A1Q5ZYU4_9SPHI|nr:oligosaccharide flippase family protein [Mucilaginibacter polytrichastri]OKS86945.1 hypothetical protein RG47T_2403 [Mucilaginibacter polytrichastri]SFS84766.1 Polysaccharide biosynthesis protein [Mucilaginibacter polytrichastri]